MYTWYCLLGLAPVTSDKAKNSRESEGREGERALSEEAGRQLAMKMRSHSKTNPNVCARSLTHYLH